MKVWAEDTNKNSEQSLITVESLCSVFSFRQLLIMLPLRIQPPVEFALQTPALLVPDRRRRLSTHRKRRPRLVITLCVVAISICSSELNLTLASLNAASEMHRSLLNNVLRQPMHTFEVYPIGRILSRFTKDMLDIDTELPFNCYEVLESSLIVSLGPATFIFNCRLA